MASGTECTPINKAHRAKNPRQHTIDAKVCLPWELIEFQNSGRFVNSYEGVTLNEHMDAQLHLYPDASWSDIGSYCRYLFHETLKKK